MKRVVQQLGHDRLWPYWIVMPAASTLVGSVASEVQVATEPATSWPVKTLLPTDELFGFPWMPPTTYR